MGGKVDWGMEAKKLVKSNPNSWLCKIGVHDWCSWSISKVELTSGGRPSSFYTTQIRHCYRCGIMESKRYL